MTSHQNFEQKNEEFNNFMHKATEVERIIQKLTSTDLEEQAIGDAEAQQYLGQLDGPKEEIVDVDSVELKIKNNRTVINKRAFEDLKNENEATMSQEAFMREVERDADRRFQDKKVRTEKMETFKKQATLAFNRGEFEKALSCYNKALELIKDNHNLFLGRGLTNMKLKLYDAAFKDIDRALYLNENSFKGLMLKAKLLFLTNNKEEMDRVMREAKIKHPQKEDMIDEYIQQLSLD